MIIKWIGAILIISSCAGFGLMIAGFHRKEVKSLKNLIYALEFMESELQFRMPALPELCRRTAEQSEGSLQKIFINLSCEMENQISPDVKHCMKSVLFNTKDLPSETRCCLCLLGESLGKFDLHGQLKSLDSVKKECKERLNKLLGNADVRIRSYQTLGICAGTALIILLM